MKRARKRLLFLTIFVAAIVSGILWLRTPKLERAGAIEKLLPSVVSITTQVLRRDFFFNAVPEEGAGSGRGCERGGGERERGERDCRSAWVAGAHASGTSSRQPNSRAKSTDTRACTAARRCARGSSATAATSTWRC